MKYPAGTGELKTNYVNFVVPGSIWEVESLSLKVEQNTIFFFFYIKKGLWAAVYRGMPIEKIRQVPDQPFWSTTKYGKKGIIALYKIKVTCLLK